METNLDHTQDTTLGVRLLIEEGRMTVAVPTSVEIDDLEDCLAATEDAVAYLKRKLERLRKGVN